MDSIAAKNRLKDLATNLKSKFQLEQSVSSFKASLHREKTRPSKKLEQFDLANKQKFIYSKVGEKPEMPKKSLAILVPVYLKKKKEYDEALKKYYSNMQSATNQYYRTYEKERHSILEEDNLNRAKTIEELTFQLNDAEKALASLSSVIDQENIVGESMKNISDVSALIEIFSNQRADSIKEAINVLYEDKHRKKMEALLKEQVRLTQEAKDAAEEATRVATAAYKKAEEALDLADDAYREARHAAREARDASSRVD